MKPQLIYVLFVLVMSEAPACLFGALILYFKMRVYFAKMLALVFLLYALNSVLSAATILSLGPVVVFGEMQFGMARLIVRSLLAVMVWGMVLHLAGIIAWKRPPL